MVRYMYHLWPRKLGRVVKRPCDHLVRLLPASSTKDVQFKHICVGTILESDVESLAHKY